MNCRDWELEIAASLDTPPAVPLAAHLAQCPSCRALREQLLLDQDDLRQLASQPLPPQALDQLHTRVMAQIPTRRFAWRIPLAIAAAAIATFVPAWMLRPSASPPVRVEQAAVVQTPPKPRVVPPPVAQTPKRVAARTPRLPSPPRRPDLMLKIETSDPDVVIYWSIDSRASDSKGELE